jgi:hypothetical protein
MPMGESFRKQTGRLLLVAGLACVGCVQPPPRDDRPDYTLDMAKEKAGPPWPGRLMPPAPSPILDSKNPPKKTDHSRPTPLTFDGVNLTTADQKTAQTLERPPESSPVPPPPKDSSAVPPPPKDSSDVPPPPGPTADADKDVITLPALAPSLPGSAVQQTAHFGQDKTPPPAVSGLRALQLEAARRYGRLDSYVARLTRHELIGGKVRREEIEVTFRKQPWSIHLKWLGGDGAGREVVYCAGQNGDQVHVLTSRGEALLHPLAGRHLRFAPGSAAVLAWTGQPLAEADLGPLIKRFGILVDAAEHGDSRAGKLKFVGQLKRPEFDAPVDAVLQAIPPMPKPASQWGEPGPPAGLAYPPPDAEASLPCGGQRWWFFDRKLHLPVLVVTQDDQDHEVEYRCYDRFLLPADRLPDEEFNPDVLWERR